MLSLLHEKRPLKKPRLGPPDVYPQDARQREDELTPANVKHGFTTMPQLADEFGTAHNSNVSASKVGAFFNSILAKKEELMTLQDTGRKKQQVNCKDNFWPVLPKTKGALDAWFKDLAGNKPLLSLAKKAPSFNKKEEVFVTLCDNQVSMQRATWFIKLSSAYTNSFTESKNKKRNVYDPAADWTGILIKFMKDLIPKLQEHYHYGSQTEKPPTLIQTPTPHGILGTPLGQITNTMQQSMSSPIPLTSPVGSAGPPNSVLGTNTSPGPEDPKNAIKYWNYCVQLGKYMHEESLLDRQEFLNWIIELLDKFRSHSIDDGLHKLILIFALQYMKDFVQSERLCRKLAYIVAKKLSYMINSMMDNNAAAQNQSLGAPGNGDKDIKPLLEGEPEKKPKSSTDPIENIILEYMNCPHHRDVVLYLSAILQIITNECPTALVWCGIGDNRASSALAGSPLDHLPVAPSALPMPARCQLTNAEVRQQLREAEEKIIIRSRHAENRWCAEKWQNANSNAYSKVLAILDALDNHCFDRMDTSNSIESLYSRIFPPFTSSRHEIGANGEMREIKIEYEPKQDATTVKILCEWAVSCQRWGEHRAMAVAWLLDKRQTEVTTPSDSEQYSSGNNGNNDDKDSIASGVGLIGGLPVFQSVLMNFLDHEAPVSDDNGSPQNRIQFTNLVHLFSELIRHDVFSHNAYLCTLISRGDLPTGSANLKSEITGTGPVSNKPSPPNQGFDDIFTSGIDFKQSNEDFDDVDDDLEKLVKNIQEKDQQRAMEAPDSPKDPDHVGQHGLNSNDSTSRHFIYTLHFPIYQEDPSSPYSSESNQRYILLYGVGKERDEKKHAVKKMSKEICKLFSKKFCIDVAEGGKVKKHSRSEFNFESTTNKCQNMAYFDQHVVTYQCAATVLEMLNSFALGNSNYLPVQEHVAFLFDLMEIALNIYGLIDMCNQILKELPEVEAQLVAKKSNLVKSYTTSLGLYIVGILRRYHSSLLLSPEQTISVFEGLRKIVKHVNIPSDCSSAERCILAYLYDLYSSCLMLKSKIQSAESFHLAWQKIKQTLFSNVMPTTSAHSYNPQFLVEMLASPRRGGKIDSLWGRQLNESSANMYSFVCNAIVAICREKDNDRLNDIAISCAELTACCNPLSAEWIAALEALCNSSEDPRYQDLFSQVDIQNLNTHTSLAIFTCILIARHCFTLENFVFKIALPALGNACNGREITPAAEAGARLACHLLLKLFKTIEIPQPGLYSVSTSPNPINVAGPNCNIKLSCDRHLLVAAHKNIPVEAVLTIFKGIMLVIDTTAQKTSTTSYNTGLRSGLNTPVHPGSTPKNMDRPVDLSQILGTSDLGNLGDQDEVMLDLQQTTAPTEQSSLSDFAQHVLKQICSQEWVLERCLQNSDALCGMLIDSMLTSKQVQRLLHMICYPENEYSIITDMDQKSIIVRILENLEQWTLRISWLDLQLMYQQTVSNPTELSNWLDTVARAAIDVFQIDEANSKGLKPKPSTWLVAPLISKLPSNVQGRILRVAGQVLESTNYFTKVKDCSEEKEKSVTNGKRKVVMNNQPFLGLILTCLKGQDEQKEGLLTSLHSQLQLFLQSLSEFENVGGIEDPSGREEMLDALQLRFSLVGGMFDAIQKNGNSTTDWAMLLAQLVCQGIIDMTSNSELFTTVIDMLATLIHSTLVSDSQSERDENKKVYTNLMKKLKKEISDKNSPSIRIVRQLLPLFKQPTEVIVCEPAGMDGKGNKICDMDKKQLRISDKQAITVWDILEGHKNPAPLSWTWFGAVKIERKPLAYEDAHRLLKYHTHSMVKPSSYYYEPMPLPPEDVEPIPEKIVKDEMKADTPSSVDQSPSAVVSGRGRGKGTRKPRKPKNSKTPPVNPQQSPQIPPQQQQQQVQQQQQMMQNQMHPMHMNMQPNSMNATMQQFVPNQMMGGGNSNQMMQQQMQGNMQQQIMPGNQQGQQMGYAAPNGMNQGHQQQQPQHQWTGSGGYNQMPQQQMYNQQGVQMNRFERPQLNNSKQVLSNMLRQRQPGLMAGNQNPAAAPGFNMQHQQQRQQGMPQQAPQQQQAQQQQQQFMRSTLRGIAPNQMNASQTSIAGMNPNMAGQMGAQTTMAQGMTGNPMMAQQNQIQRNPMMQTGQAQPGMAIGQSGPMMSGNAGMMGQQNAGMVNANIAQGGGMMQQQNVGMGNQNSQFQNYPAYANQGMNQQAGQQTMMGGFNQMGGQRQNPGEYMGQRAMPANRGQYINQAPNITMNNMMGQGAAPPYNRQQAGGGKPSVVATQQFQQQQQRMRQQMMMQGMGQNQVAGGMGQPQNQSMGQQQTPELVAQLQRAMPNQQAMMGQQYSHQPPPY